MTGLLPGRVGTRARVAAFPRLEVGLLVAGVVLTAVGAPVARLGSAVALLPLDVVILALAAALVLLTRRLTPDLRRFAAAAGVLLLLVAVPVTRIPSPGETIVVLAVAIAALTVAGLRGSGTHAAASVPRTDSRARHGGPGSPSRARFRARWPAAAVPGAALVVLLGVVTAVSPDRYGLLRFAPFVLAAVSAFLLVAGASGAVRVRLARFVVLLALAETLLALVEPVIGAPQLWTPAKINAAGIVKTLPNPFLPDLVRAQGTLGHPLLLGVLLLVAIALLVGNAARLPARVRLVAGSVLALGLLASGSRNSLIVAALLAIVFLPRWRFTKRTVVVVLVGAAVVAVLLVAAAPVIERWLASGSVTHRAGALDALLSLLQQPVPTLLLGNGWASSGRMFAAGLLQTDGLDAVDDEFVLLLSQGGVLAVLLFVAVLVLAARTLSRSMLPAFVAVVATCLVFDLLAWPVGAALAAGVLASGRSRIRRSSATRRIQRGPRGAAREMSGSAEELRIREHSAD